MERERRREEKRRRRRRKEQGTKQHCVTRGRRNK
jgi:hypothetical protein